MGGPPPQHMERQEARPAGAVQVQATQMTVTKGEDGTIVTETRTGDDVVVEIREAPQQGSFQPGQGAPGQEPQGQRPPGGGNQQGGPESPREIPRERRYATNPSNPDIRRDDFNRDQEERGLRIDFQKVPWRVAIEWFASEAGLSLELESAPPGTFSYHDSTNRYYSIDETFNVLNSCLIRQNFLLVRTSKLLLMINLNDGIPVDLIRDVPLEKLDEVGDYEVVRVLFNLTGTTPEVVGAEIQQLLGPQGLVTPLSRSQQIYVTEFGDKLRTIREVIEGIDNPEKAGVLEKVTLKYLAADMAVTQLKALLPLSDNDTTLRVLIDPTGQSIWLSGRIDRVESAKRMLQKMDIPTDTTGVYLEVYPIPSADPDTVLNIVRTTLAGRPDVRASLDKNTGAIAVQGRAEDHRKVREAIDKLEEFAYKIEVIQLRRLSTTTAKDAIEEYFKAGTSTGTTGQRNPFQPAASSTSSTTANLTAPIVTVNTSQKQLIVKGTVSQIDQIKTLLTKMGEPIGVGGNAPVNHQDVRPIPMPEKQAQIVLQMVQQMWPQMGHREINVVTPSQILKLSPDARTQPLQFGPELTPSQPWRTPADPNTTPNTMIMNQESSPRSLNGEPLPDSLIGVPRERIHYIDGMAGENSQENVTPPRPMQQNDEQQLPPQPTVRPRNDGNDTPNSVTPADIAPGNSVGRSQIDLHLDSLFGPAEDVPALQKNAPAYIPANAPENTQEPQPSEGRLRTQWQQAPGRYVSVAYRQEQAVEDEPEQTTEEPPTEATPVAETTNEPAATPETETTPTEATPVVSLPDVVVNETESPIGIVPNPNATLDARPLEANAETDALPQPSQFRSQQRDRNMFDRERPDRGMPPGRPGDRSPMRDGEPRGDMRPGYDAGQPAQQNQSGDVPSANSGEYFPDGQISVTVGTTGIVAAGDSETLDLFEELLHSFNSEGIFKSPVTEFYLIKNAKADTIKSMLTSLLGSTTSTTSSSSVSDSMGGAPSDPMEALMANMFGGSKIQATGPYEIMVDARSNMLIINANRIDHLTIQELLPILDRLGSNDKAIDSRPHLITLQNMKAEDAETAVRTIFVDNLQGANNQGGNRNQQQGNRGGNQGGMPGGMMMPGMPGGMMGGGGPQEFIQMMQRARGGQQQNQQISQTEVQTMTLAVETTTNSLIVYSPEELFLQVEAFVTELDRISLNQEPTTTVVPYSQNSPAYISSVLKAWMGDSVTVTNNATSSTNRNQQQGNRGGFGGGMMMPGGNRGGMPGGMGGFGGMPGGMMMGGRR